MSRLTDEQVVKLARIERGHGEINRIPDDSPHGELLLSQCLTGTRAYACMKCRVSFTIEPDGEVRMWRTRPASTEPA